MATGRYKVLALDGGGIRGVIPARVLEEIERRCGKPIAEMFDMISGTSTGGIITLGLTKPDASGTRPQYSASDMLRFYTEQGATIFSKSFGRKVASLFGLTDARYSAKPLETLLEGHFGDAMLSSALKEVVIPSYDISGPAPFFFKKLYAKKNSRWDVPMKMVARATSAAPTYFNPAELSLDGKRHELVDGGTFANNPAVSAYVDAVHIGDDQDQFLVVSIGTGQPPQTPGSGPIPVRPGHPRHWGLIRWVRPILEVVLDGAPKAVGYQMDQLQTAKGSTLKYHRLQSLLPTASHAMDDASPQNIAKLLADADTLIKKSAAELDAICAAIC
jgi:predicted acylesterase/phospholipase RssA